MKPPWSTYTYTAPAPPLCAGSDTTAVLPSADRATEKPNNPVGAPKALGGDGSLWTMSWPALQAFPTPVKASTLDCPFEARIRSPAAETATAQAIPCFTEEVSVALSVQVPA